MKALPEKDEYGDLKGLISLDLKNLCMPEMSERHAIMGITIIDRYLVAQNICDQLMPLKTDGIIKDFEVNYHTDYRLNSHVFKIEISVKDKKIQQTLRVPFIY